MQPSRIDPLPKAKVDEAIVALVSALEGDGFARLEYPPEPTRHLSFDDIADAIRTARAERQLDASLRSAVQDFSAWRQEVTKRRSQNEARLATLLWALDRAERDGDSFTAGAVASFLREQWRVFDPPTANERDTFVRNVCAIECRRGVMEL